MEPNSAPVFRQAPSGNARLAFFAALSLALMIGDAKWNAVSTLRQGIADVLHPLQRALLVPRDALQIGSDYVGEVSHLRRDNEALRQAQAANARALLEHESLMAENRRLRDLAGARERIQVRSTLVEVLYETRDPFSRKIVLDKGLREGIGVGQPVIDASGLVGQVTRTYEHSSEMTPITDASMTVPVMVQRSGVRSIVFGSSSRAGQLELRYLASNADLRKGDHLTTSGLDRIYPPGLPVGEVSDIERGGRNDLARALVVPATRLSRSAMLIVLQVDTSMVPPLPPEAADPAPVRARR